MESQTRGTNLEAILLKLGLSDLSNSDGMPRSGTYYVRPYAGTVEITIADLERAANRLPDAPIWATSNRKFRSESQADFFTAVSYSLTEKARDKGYEQAGDNVFLAVCKLLDLDKPHGIGEIIGKLIEYRKTPRRVLLEKCAGWLYLLWKETAPDAR